MPDPETRPQTKPFAAFVQEQRQGLLHAELSDQLAEVVAAAIEHRKAGSVTLTVSIKPGEMPGTLIVTDDVKAKVPEQDKQASLFFADDHGNLSRRDPRQPELPLREVTGEPSTTDLPEAASS